MQDKYNEQDELLKSYNLLEIDMIKETKSNFNNVNMPDFNVKYKDNEIKNKEKALKDILKWSLAIFTVWKSNKKVLDKNKQDIYDITYNAFNISANKLGLAFYTKKEFDKLVEENLKKTKINVSNIFNAKSEWQYKKLKRNVTKAIENNATKKELLKVVSTNFYNQGIKTTSNLVSNEFKRYQTYSQTTAEKNLTMVKQWVYTHRSKEPRDWHIEMNGQIADEKGYFHSSTGMKSQAPRQFGASIEDINCRCEMKLKLSDELTLENYNRRKIVLDTEKEVLDGKDLTDDRIDGIIKKNNSKNTAENRKIANDYTKIREYRISQRNLGNQYWRDVEKEKWKHSQSDVNELKRIGLVDDDYIKIMKEKGYL